MQQLKFSIYNFNFSFNIGGESIDSEASFNVSYNMFACLRQPFILIHNESWNICL